MTDLTYLAGDGTRLEARVVAAAAGAANARPLVLLHGGGPDHRSLLPLAIALADRRRVILPDVRGYGRSVCRDPARHTWDRYVEDLVDLLDALGLPDAVVGGAGQRATIALRAALAHPERVAGVIALSVEDIEDDAARAGAVAFMDAYAGRVREAGLEAAWAPILEDLAPVIGAMVREALPRADAESLAAAAAIGRDRPFGAPAELYGLAMPVLLCPGADPRHPAALAEHLAARLVRGRLAAVSLAAARSAEDFAAILAPPVRRFLAEEGL